MQYTGFAVALKTQGVYVKGNVYFCQYITSELVRVLVNDIPNTENINDVNFMYVLNVPKGITKEIVGNLLGDMHDL